MKRILDCQSSDFCRMGREDLLSAIAGSEGRTIACETIGAIQPMLGDITNAEFAAAMGADILLLNMFDVQNPRILGLPKTQPENTVRKLKELTGRPIGINLEPVEQLRILSDAFTLPGYLLIFAGVLLHLSNKGAMDGVSYVFTRMIQLLIPTAALKRESYPDFVERRREKNVTGFGFLFIIGVVCLLVSFVILYFYFAVS